MNAESDPLPPAPELTEWDAKMQARRRTNERPETRQLREAAEGPGAAASTLIEIWGKTWRLWRMNGTKNDMGVVLAMEAVACHPNAPPDVLWDLYPVCARAFCANPIAPLVLLETPDFVDHLSHEMGNAILREEAAPPALVSVIAGSKTGKDGSEREARLHIALSGEVETQTEWETALNTYWQQFCQQFVPPRKDNETRDLIYAHWHCDLAELGLAPAWFMEPLLWIEPTVELRPDANEWLRFACSPNSPEEQALWAKIAPAFKDKPGLAKHLRKTATPFDLMALVHMPGSERGVLREIITAHPSATETVLVSLSRAKYVKPVREHIAASPHAPTALLEKLAQDEDPLVRRLVRRNPNAPPRARALSRRAALKQTRTQAGSLSLFVQFAGGLHGAFERDDLALRGQSDGFASRLSAALFLSTKPAPLNRDPANRTSRDLLRHLARDGNRLVRWAAQTRLRDPGFVFAWNDAG